MGHLTYKSVFLVSNCLPVTDVFSSHVIRAIYGLSYETFEVTGPQMVLTMKLTTYAWNVWDGRRPVEVRVDLIH